MGDSYREEIKKNKARIYAANHPACPSGTREAREKRSQALKGKQSRPKSPYGTPSTQGRLLDA